MVVAVVVVAVLAAAGGAGTVWPGDPRFDDTPTTVLVAGDWIPAGTSGRDIALRPLYVPSLLPRSSVDAGAFSEPRQMVELGETGAEVAPGTVLTASLFG